ncbi:helix-turn-helix domain-containing protein [Symbioplanes lichenis]|uniref:helix-turn-helix domain-containing protein n=1 Tax=Symbioplanes lichenis TaxID=1629072 RepID=UPI002739ED39|nr:helix-turn-helix transcriptional regulator [Actinoplanes lichenis]
MTSPWFLRLERVRTERNMSVEDLLRQLQVSRATYYQYRARPERHPRDPGVVSRIAAFLGEDPAALTTEMVPAPGPAPTVFLEAAAARELNVALYQQHVRALAHILGMGAQEPRPQGVDVAVRMLRELLPAPPDPVDAVVVLAPVGRGRTAAGPGPDPYQYQIYVVPRQLAEAPEGRSGRRAEQLISQVRAKVDRIMDGALIPVSREHSTDLALPLFRGMSDLLLYPGLLEMRPPGVRAVPRPGVPSVLVTGVYYAGAPDVAALLARELGYGFSTFDQLARLHAREGLRGLPSDQFKTTIAGVAHEVLSGPPAASGPMVWATDDPDALLDERGRAWVHDFAGPVVLLVLGVSALDYAAYRLCCVDANRPCDADTEAMRRMLTRQQEALLALAAERPLLTHTIELPSRVVRAADGVWSDAVDDMFDAYESAFHEIAGKLR